MSSWMEMILFNAASATVVAILVALAAPRIRRPAVVHALWLLVLLKLIAPPVFEIGLVPRWDRTHDNQPIQTGVLSEGDANERPAGVQSTTIMSGAASLTTVEDAGQRTSAGWQFPTALVILCVSVLGTLLFLSVSILHLVRFRRRLGELPEVPNELQARANQLALAFGIKRQPRLRLVDAQIPPSLWPGSGRGEILLPAGLLKRLTMEQCDALLAHELAHLKRRDHWLRLLELAVVSLYWWHPVAWWARRNLRIAEEQACDALVLHTLDGGSRTYAESLLKTVEFLAVPERAVPSLAMGATGTSRLKERITMIMKTKSSAPLAKPLMPVLYAALLLILVVSPAWVQKATSADKPFKDSNPEYEHQEALLVIHEKEVQLQREMQRLEQERQSVRLKIDEKLMQQQLQEMRQDAARLENESRASEAEVLRERIILLEREAELHHKQVEAEQLHMQKRMQIEHQLQDLMLQMQKAEITGALERVNELQQESLALDRALRQVDLEAMQADIERQRQLYEHEMKELQSMKP